MKLCINCKHYAPAFGLCNSPANGISPEDGKPKPRIASIERSDYKLLLGSVCGPDGVNFEQYTGPYIDPADYTQQPKRYLVELAQMEAKFKLKEEANRQRAAANPPKKSFGTLVREYLGWSKP